MPELKPIHVVLLLAVMAIVALYVLGVGLGATSKSPAQSNPMETASKLRERFLKPRAVTAEELATACPFKDGVLTVATAATCVVEVKTSDTRTRSLELIPQPPSTVKVELLPKGKPSVPATIKSLEESRKVDVSEEGAELKVTCRQPKPALSLCELRLLPKAP
ncbi:hypothetical protein ACLESO_28160 [Pyxidicoccus sp. 3LG]